MGVSNSKEQFSNEKIEELIDKFVEFIKEKNIDLNHVLELSEDDKNELIQKFNDLFEYLAYFVFNDKLKDEMNDELIEEFKYTISEEELSKVTNKKSFIKMKESIQSIMEDEDSQDFFDFISKFKYVNEYKELIFKSKTEDLNEELKSNLNYVVSYLKKKNDDMNVLNKTINDSINSLSTKVSTVLENMIQRDKIVDKIDKLNTKIDFKTEECKKILSFLKNIKPENYTKDYIFMLDKATELSNDISIFQSEKKLLREDLNKIAKESFNRCTTEQQKLIEKYISDEISKEEFYEKVCQKPLDEIDDLRYQDEIRRIIEIYNNSSKANEDKKDIINKMGNFIKLSEIKLLDN